VSLVRNRILEVKNAGMRDVQVGSFCACSSYVRLIEFSVAASAHALERGAREKDRGARSLPWRLFSEQRGRARMLARRRDLSVHHGLLTDNAAGPSWGCGLPQNSRPVKMVANKCEALQVHVGVAV
jgi:hypothetical protein